MRRQTSLIERALTGQRMTPGAHGGRTGLPAPAPRRRLLPVVKGDPNRLGVIMTRHATADFAELDNTHYLFGLEEEIFALDYATSLTLPFSSKLGLDFDDTTGVFTATVDGMWAVSFGMNWHAVDGGLGYSWINAPYDGSSYGFDKAVLDTALETPSAGFSLRTSGDRVLRLASGEQLSMGVLGYTPGSTSATASDYMTVTIVRLA